MVRTSLPDVKWGFIGEPSGVPFTPRREHDTSDFPASVGYVRWFEGDETMEIDGHVTPEDLRAMADWMETKQQECEMAKKGKGKKC